jgi:AspT/YidE/YbjL antiporter-like protein
VTPETKIYVGDVMTLVGLNQKLSRVVPRIGQAIRLSDRIDMAFLASGLVVGWLFGLLSFTMGSIPLTLGGGGGALIAGLVFGWIRSRRPTMGAFPPAAQQALSDLGLGGFIASIGLASGPAALAAVQAHGFTLLSVGIVVTLTPLVVGTLFAHRVLRNRQHRFDGPRADHRWAHFYRLNGRTSAKITHQNSHCCYCLPAGGTLAARSPRGETSRWQFSLSTQATAVAGARKRERFPDMAQPSLFAAPHQCSGRSCSSLDARLNASPADSCNHCAAAPAATAPPTPAGITPRRRHRPEVISLAMLLSADPTHRAYAMGADPS